MMPGSGTGQNYRFSFDKIHGETEATGSSSAVAIDLACTSGFNKIVLEAGEVMNFYVGTFSQVIGGQPYRLSLKNTTLDMSNILYDYKGSLSVDNNLELYNVTGFYGKGVPGGYVYSKKHNGVDGDDRVMDYSTGDSVNMMQTATDQRHTASGYSWKYTVATSRTLLDPFVFPLAVIPCPAGEARTVKLWVIIDQRGDIASAWRIHRRSAERRDRDGKRCDQHLGANPDLVHADRTRGGAGRCRDG